MLAKTDIVGASSCDLYKWLQDETKSEITWNFAKYLIDQEG